MWEVERRETCTSERGTLTEGLGLKKKKGGNVP